MTEFSDDDLIDYVLGIRGTATADLQRQLLVDEELAAQVSLMLAMSGRPDPSATPYQEEEKARVASERALDRLLRLTRQRIMAASLVAACVLLVSGAWASWAYIHRPLLEDHFLRRTFDSLRWAAPRPQVRPEYGYIKLTNRGYLVTQQEFDGPIELSFRWRWLDLAENPLYSDDMTVALRTTGEPTEERPFDIKDGVRIVFSTQDSRVHVRAPAAEDAAHPLDFTQRRTEIGQVPVPSERWHDIRIRDDGRTIDVFITGPELPKENAKKPVLSVAWPLKERGRKIAFYNRQMLAWAAHESHITDVVVRKLEP